MNNRIMAICSFLSAQYAARTAIEIETASPCAIAAKTTAIMVSAVAALTAAHAMLRAIHMRCWRSAMAHGAIGVGAAKNLKLLGEPQGEPIKPEETVATVEGCPWSIHKKM